MMNPGYGRPGPYGMGGMVGGFGNRGPMPPYGPGGNMGFGNMGPPGGNMGPVNGGMGPGNQNVSFFGSRQGGPQMGDARTGPMQPGQQMTPSATTVGRGNVGNQGGQGNSLAPGSEVPGFGTNSSIHELFGKMVWKKMEGLRDEAVIDKLQNSIMNMIHEALAQQSKDASGQGGVMNGHAGGFKAF